MKIRVHFEDRILRVPVGIDHLTGRQLDDAINEWLEETFPNFDTGWKLSKRDETKRTNSTESKE